MLGFAKCGHCGKSGTKLAIIEPSGAAYKQSAICCSFCNAILGVTGFYDAGTLIKEQEKKIGQLLADVSTLSQHVAHLTDVLSRRG
jgi:hypothetical protein